MTDTNANGLPDIQIVPSHPKSGAELLQESIEELEARVSKIDQNTAELKTLVQEMKDGLDHLMNVHRHAGPVFHP